MMSVSKKPGDAGDVVSLHLLPDHSMEMNSAERLAILSPLVLASDLFFLLRSEVICDVECFSDFLGRLSLDHVGNSLTSDVEKGFDVKVIGGLQKDISCAFRSRVTNRTYKNDLKEHLLIHLHELLVPFLDIGGLLAGVGIVINSGRRVVLVMFAPLNNFLQNRLIDLK
jgi:hypothetical protein